MTNKKYRAASVCLIICTISLFTFDVCRGDGTEWLLASDVYETANDIKSRGLAWLKGEKNTNFGWDAGDTPRAILAIASAEKDWPMKDDLKARLTAKQLEIELLEKLIRHDVEPVTPRSIALYALALNAVCKDPRNFYGHNLIVSLEKHHKDQDYPTEAFGFSLTALVSCLSGSHLHKRQIRHLLLIANDGTSMDSIDTRSISILALECFRRKRHNDALTKPMMGEAVKNLALLQQPEGSFGNNIFTTAMAIQALSVVNDLADPEVTWNHTAAVLALSKMQLSDGSFLHSVHATAEAVISVTTLLNGVGLLQVKRGKCVDFPERTGKLVEKSTESSSSFSPPSSSFSSTSSSASSSSSLHSFFFTQPHSLSSVSPVLISTTITSNGDGDDAQTIKGLTETPVMLPPAESRKDFNNEKTAVLLGPASLQSQLETTTTSTTAANTTTNNITTIVTTPTSISSVKLPTSGSETRGESSSAIYASTEETTQPMASIRYWLWIGSEPGAAETEKVNITLQVPVNSTFFSVMMKAASLHPQYEFSAALWPNGHYIHTLSGHREQPVGYHYWLLYALPTDPDPANPPPTTFVSPSGVDSLYVNDGDVYLYWYRKL